MDRGRGACVALGANYGNWAFATSSWENGSGLHRRSAATAATVVDLLSRIHASPALRRRLLPTLAVAAKTGTLRARMGGTSAAGLVYAKTGTLHGVLALSGYVAPNSPRPLAFSILVNGSSDRRVRNRMDRIAAALAAYARRTAVASAS